MIKHSTFCSLYNFLANITFSKTKKNKKKSLVQSVRFFPQCEVVTNYNGHQDLIAPHYSELIKGENFSRVLIDLTKLEEPCPSLLCLAVTV